jgi:hypothetical protein
MPACPRDSGANVLHWDPEGTFKLTNAYHAFTERISYIASRRPAGGHRSEGAGKKPTGLFCRAL